MDDVRDIVTQKVDILEYIGRYVELNQNNNEYYGLCPFHSEVTPSFSVTPSVRKFYCFGCGIGGDVITFASRFHGVSIQEATSMLADELGDVDTSDIRLTSQTYKYIKAYQSYKSLDKEGFSHTVLDNSVLEQFAHVAITPWLEEGISQEAIEKYNVRLDVSNSRIVYPVYSNDGRLINIKGRIVFDDFKAVGAAKYINYYKVGKLDYLQGYSINKDFIQSANEIIIFEGIKSCMKLDDCGIHNSVSAETSRLSDYQVRFLARQGYNVVIAFDSDVDIKKIRNNVKMLSRFTNVSIIFDRHNLLPPKSSPIDAGYEVWEQLYNERVRL